MRKILYIIIFVNSIGFAQDPIHTQFFMIPETLSSSFTGAKQSTRAGIIHRTQWPGLNFSINTQFAFVDNWFEEIKSGVGISVLNHKETTTRYNFTQVNLNYAYQFPISEDWNVRPSISVGYGAKDFGFQNLVLEDQINIFSGIINVNSIDPIRLN
jgi:type IX secretion system PorP/SprF family membrane protein